MTGARYGYQHQKARAALLAEHDVCSHCGKAVGWDEKPGVADHQPPLALHAHAEGTGCCDLIPSCATCSYKQAGAVRNLVGKMGATEITFAEPPPSPGPEDACWDAAPWLEPLREVPDDAVWPRWLTQPHPAAIGTYLDEFETYTLERAGITLRWWQRLLAATILQHDLEGQLVFPRAWWSTARQLGKSLFGRSLLLFAADVLVPRLFAGIENDGVIILSRQLLSAEQVMEPEIRWAIENGDRGWETSRSKGQKHIEAPSGSRVLIRSIKSTPGLTATALLTDEAWDVVSQEFLDAAEPTLLATGGPSWATSTSHSKATSFALNLRSEAFDQIDAPDDLCIVEWGADKRRDREDRDGWREASPSWTPARERMIAARLKAAQNGEALTEGEDPMASFDAQMLNLWPTTQMKRGRGQAFLERGAWARALVTGAAPIEHRVVAIENDFGKGLSVVVAGISSTGRIAVEGQAFSSAEEGWAFARSQTNVAHWCIGATMFHSPPARDLAPTTCSGTGHTRNGLGVVRSLIEAGELTHTGNEDLAQQVLSIRVRETGSGIVIAAGRGDLVRAMSWAVSEVNTRRDITVAVY